MFMTPSLLYHGSRYSNHANNYMYCIYMYAFVHVLYMYAAKEINDLPQSKI